MNFGADCLMTSEVIEFANMPRIHINNELKKNIKRYTKKQTPMKNFVFLCRSLWFGCSVLLHIPQMVVSAKPLHQRIDVLFYHSSGVGVLRCCMYCVVVCTNHMLSSGVKCRC